MSQVEQVTNIYSEKWQTEYRESGALSHLSGFLITYADQCCIVVDNALEPIHKESVRQKLRECLATKPLGEACVLVCSRAEAVK